MPKSEKGSNSVFTNLTEKKKKYVQLFFSNTYIKFQNPTASWLQRYERSQKHDVRTNKRTKERTGKPEAGGTITDANLYCTGLSLITKTRLFKYEGHLKSPETRTIFPSSARIFINSTCTESYFFPLEHGI